MASRIDWYLVELERRIGSLLSEEEAFTVLTETEDHLRSKASDLVSRGMTVSQAERAATSSFGSPISVAFGVLDEKRSILRERIGLGVLLIGTAMFLCFLGFALTYVGPGYGPVGLPVFIILAGGLLSRRLAIKPVVGLGVLAGLAIGGVMVANNVSGEGANGFYLPRPLLENRMESSRSERSALNSGLARLTSGLDYYTKLKNAAGNAAKVVGAPLRDSNGELVLLPQKGYSISTSQLGVQQDHPIRLGNYFAYYDYTFYAGDMTHLSPYEPSEFAPGYGSTFYEGHAVKPTLTQAMDRWLAVGPSLITTTEHRIQRLDGAISADQQELNAPWRFSTPVFLLGIGIGLISSAGIVMAQWLAMFVARGFRWVRAAMPRFA